MSQQQVADWNWGDDAAQSPRPQHPRTPWDPDGLGVEPPRAPRPLPVGVRVAAPVLSESVEPNRVHTLRPTDLRMRNWRLRVPPGAEPVRYVPRYPGMDRKSHWWEETLTWEHPITGEVRRCPAQALEPWGDPWWQSTQRINAELAHRVCTCGAVTWPGGSLCVCAHELTGWTEYDDYWMEPEFGVSVKIAVDSNKPVTVKPRTLPAQHPMSTWRSRFRDRLWRWTRPLAKEI